MEILKYRAWDSENKKFTYWTMNDLCTWDEKDEKPSALDEWQQFTGLVDQKGKEIYVGDIVSRLCTDEHCQTDHTGEVFYNTHWTMFSLREKGSNLIREMGGFYPPLAFGDLSNGILLPLEVIGNVHENAELLK